MLKNKLLHFVLLLIFTSSIVSAQNNTNSPYTRFGFGDINDNYTGEQRAMGGVAIGSRSKSSINTVNPASYSAVDSMTFMFDIGASVLGSRFTINDQSTNKLNANLEYLTMQFPLWKNSGFSMGVLPYSFTGYNYSTSELVTELPNLTATKTYFGSGGVSQAYAGFGIQVFKGLSLGINAYYMFGNNMNSRLMTFDNATLGLRPSFQNDTIKVNSFRFRYGLQYNYQVGASNNLTFGAFFEPKTNLKARYNESTGSIVNSPSAYLSTHDMFELPQNFGLGLNYKIDNKITFAMDYSLQNWADVKFLGVTDTLANRSRLAVGAEIIPNPRSRKYFNRVTYRAGANMSDPYYKLDGIEQPKNFGITFGFGLPLASSKSVVNATFEYGKIGSSSVLKEDYFKFTLNAVINENWFFKRKL